MKFTIPGEPTAKGRPRFTKTGRTYTPEKTANYEAMVGWYFNQTKTDDFEMLQDCVTANIICYFKIPNSMSKKNTVKAEYGVLRPTKKPDLDNIAKSILDSLNGLAYKDDSQVIGLQIEKYYSKEPRVEVELMEV